MRKVWNIITNLILGILILFILAFFVLFAMGMRPYVIVSGSMEPTIQTGSVCFVDETVTYEEVQENDIIAYEAANGSYVTHRAIDITESGIETQGDNNDVSDGVSTTEENFIGLTKFSIPYLGYFSRFIATTTGKVVVGAIFLIFIIVGKIGKEGSSDKKKKHSGE